MQHCAWTLRSTAMRYFAAATPVPRIGHIEHNNSSHAAKSDVSSLTVADFLRRDYKQVELYMLSMFTEPVTRPTQVQAGLRACGVASVVGISLEDFFAKVRTTAPTHQLASSHSGAERCPATDTVIH